MGCIADWISRHRSATSEIHGPLKMTITVQSSVYTSPLSSFGVSRNICEVEGLDAALVMRLKIFRSLTGSMPWLISSTTRNGARVSSCSEMRYSIVDTLRSPPLCLVAVRTCMSSAARNLTQISSFHCSYASPADSLSLTSPAHPMSAMLFLKFSFTVSTNSRTLGSQNSRVVVISACLSPSLASASIKLASNPVISSWRFWNSSSTTPLGHMIALASFSTMSIDACNSSTFPGHSANLILCSAEKLSMGASRWAISFFPLARSLASAQTRSSVCFSPSKFALKATRSSYAFFMCLTCSVSSAVRSAAVESACSD
mmetsp:Transcript_2152/g.5007  ORF Transcript_2152/g.5007 Transcript_2152/m.5007 type:complete len:315 (-) Transcript_2152:2507-3451(-)